MKYTTLYTTHIHIVCSIIIFLSPIKFFSWLSNNEDLTLELVSKELNQFGVIAGLFFKTINLRNHLSLNGSRERVIYKGAFIKAYLLITYYRTRNQDLRSCSRIWDVFPAVTSQVPGTYRKVASSNTSHLEAHAGSFRSLMKSIFDPYVLCPFDKKLIS